MYRMKIEILKDLDKETMMNYFVPSTGDIVGIIEGTLIVFKYEKDFKKMKIEIEKVEAEEVR